MNVIFEVQAKGGLGFCYGAPRLARSVCASDSCPHSRGFRSPPLIQPGPTHVVFEPLDFISRLVALAPKPRVNLTRCIRTQ